MSPESTSLHFRHILTAALLFAVVSLSCLLLFRDADYSHFASSYSFPRFPTGFPFASDDSVAVSSVSSHTFLSFLFRPNRDLECVGFVYWLDYPNFVLVTVVTRKCDDYFKLKLWVVEY
jgi:hypothetical protein